MENKLREFRVVRRMSQMKLGSIANVHSSKISLIENGWLKPRKDEIERLSAALRAPSEEIFPGAK